MTKNEINDKMNKTVKNHLIIGQNIQNIDTSIYFEFSFL